MKTASTNHTVLDGANRVTHNKPTPVKQPVQRQPRKFVKTGRGGCASCGQR